METKYIKHFFFAAKLGVWEKREFTPLQLEAVTSWPCFDPIKGIPESWAHALIEYWNEDPSFRNRYSLGHN